jgi:hypothetical protein
VSENGSGLPGQAFLFSLKKSVFVRVSILSSFTWKRTGGLWSESNSGRAGFLKTVFGQRVGFVADQGVCVATSKRS